MHNLRKYIAIFNLSARHALKNKKALAGLSLFLITCLIIFSHLWKVAANKLGAIEYNQEQLLWYIAFNEWVLISIPDIQEEMEYDLRSGRLAYLLPRPASYLLTTLAEALGALFANLNVLGIVAFLFTWFVVGSLPFSIENLLLAIVLGFAAGVLGVLFHMLIGLSAFWLQEVSPFFWIWEKLLFMLGGLILPLKAYPDWMQRLACATPFPVILGDRSALALGISGLEICSLILRLLFWIALASLILKFAYHKGLRILNIEGG